jgi:two-component system alkaline phosphatase synthesis response regulator PhoP
MSLIYIVEDDANIREIESFALKNSGHNIVEFEYAKDLYKKLLDKVPDLIILDVMLPDEDGLEIVKKLRNMQKTKKIPILMVTAKTTEIDKVKGLDIGADDYLTKPFGIMELISRVKALIRRSSGDINEEKLLTSGDVFIDGEKHAVYVKGELCELTYKEHELLKLLVLNKGIVIPRDVIMERLWGIDFEGESRTLDMHIKTLRHKLKESGAAIKTIRSVGYMIE